MMLIVNSVDDVDNEILWIGMDIWGLVDRRYQHIMTNRVVFQTER